MQLMTGGGAEQEEEEEEEEEEGETPEAALMPSFLSTCDCCG